ncbi:MAG: dihydroneopterin aldolase [Candidatus Omnitrophica bacterium]|nr:dihydroneopterin aldolase [Candidatus Omnitrophota bacterium]
MKDKIFLQRLEISCIIGIFDWERKVKQKVWIDLEMPADARRAARSDSIQDTLDYKGISKRVIQFISASRFHLIETLAEKTASVLLDEFNLSEIFVRVSKPGAVRGSKNVGIEIFRKKTPKRAARKKRA